MLQTLRFLPRHYDLVRELVSYDVCNVYRVRYVKVPGRCRSGKWREDLRIKQGNTASVRIPRIETGAQRRGRSVG